jgi:hypothetical protein
MPVTARIVLAGAAVDALMNCCKGAKGAVMGRALDVAGDDAGNLLPIKDASAATEGKSNT